MQEKLPNYSECNVLRKLNLNGDFKSCDPHDGVPLNEERKLYSYGSYLFYDFLPYA
jgi:hypothetical protein